MRQNKYLFFIAVSLLPFVVISFAFRGKTNFSLENENGTPMEDYKKDISYKVLLDNETGVETLELEDYIIGVVAGEMPASFMEEALKAQAVASRTYVLFKRVEDEEIISVKNGTSAQVYIDEEQMRDKWGSDFQKYYDKIKKAVLETKGEIITYEGNIIEAFYFAMSSGNTNDSKSVFGEARDYLQSVSSDYDNEELNGFLKEVSFTKRDFREKLGIDCDEPNILGLRRNEAGYVDTIEICSKEFKGTEVRTKLGLRSSNFEISIGEDVRVNTYGYGHGVGMSQYGANGYALHGYTYEDIIKHYYSGVEIKNLKSV